MQEQWDKAQRFQDTGSAASLMKLLIKTARAAVSTTKVPFRDDYMTKDDEEAANMVSEASKAQRNAKKKKDKAKADEVSQADDAALCLAARRGVVAKLCQVFIDFPNTAIPVPVSKCRPLTLQEGQRPIREAKVLQCGQLFSVNPHTTPQQMQMVALNHKLTPEEAAEAYKVDIAKDDVWTAEADVDDQPYGISGGQHYHLGIKKSCNANPKLKEYTHAQCHITELFALGWLDKIDTYYREQMDADKALSYTGVDGFQTRQYTNDAAGQAGIQAILPTDLWNSLTSKEKSLLPSKETAITMLVREHNDVAQLSHDSTFREKLQCLRDTCEEQELPPDAAKDGCRGVEEKLLGNMIYKIKVKGKKELLPYLRIALSPTESWDLLQRVFYRHSNWGLKGQRKPKKKKGDDATVPPIYHRQLSILWEQVVPEKVRQTILGQLLDGEITLKDAKDQKTRQVTILTLLKTLLLHMRWDEENHISKEQPSSIQAVKDVLKYELSSDYLDHLVTKCPAVQACTHSWSHYITLTSSHTSSRIVTVLTSQRAMPCVLERAEGSYHAGTRIQRGE